MKITTKERNSENKELKITHKQKSLPPLNMTDLTADLPKTGEGPQKGNEPLLFVSFTLHIKQKA